MFDPPHPPRRTVSQVVCGLCGLVALFVLGVWLATATRLVVAVLNSQEADGWSLVHASLLVLIMQGLPHVHVALHTYVTWRPLQPLIDGLFRLFLWSWSSPIVELDPALEAALKDNPTIQAALTEILTRDPGLDDPTLRAELYGRVAAELDPLLVKGWTQVFRFIWGAGPTTRRQP